MSQNACLQRAASSPGEVRLPDTDLKLIKMQVLIHLAVRIQREIRMVLVSQARLHGGI